ncbi:EAP30/Vps36 family-domain-containing protein [Dipodascopsis uninucleata]
MSMKRGVGLAAFDQKQRNAQQYSELGSTFVQTQVSELLEQLTQFQTALRKFAQTHAEEIRSDAVFRSAFVKMCSAIGVDPLASSTANRGGSFWAELLGRDVAVRIIELCRRTRDENGGFMPVEDVRRRLGDVSQDDIVRAVKSLEPLGSGFDIVKIGGREFIRSVPQELSRDQSVAFEATSALGYVSIPILVDNLGWEPARATAALEDLLSAGLVWLDGQTNPAAYWSPSWISMAPSLASE